jgi:hypothetical protein
MATQRAIPATVQVESTGQMTDVEVELYSGRPNPRFTLSPANAAELQRRLDQLPPAGAGGSMPDGLGYRGVRVNEGATEVVVSAGMVEIHDGQGVKRKLDQGRKLEGWLIEAVGSQMQQTELDYIRNELRH